MKDSVVRLRSITISHIKNVSHGYIELPARPQSGFDSRHAEVLGIYGQNGSGKTVLVDACYFLQQIMTGKSLDPDFADYISRDSSYAEIAVAYLITCEQKSIPAEYRIRITRSGQRPVSIAREQLSLDDRLCIDFRAGSNEPPEPFLSYPDRLSLLLVQKMAERSGTSFLFGEHGRELFSSKDFAHEFEEYSSLLEILYRYSRSSFFVIRNFHSGVISANLALPMTFPGGDFVVPLHDAVVLDHLNADFLDAVVAEINTVIYTIIPGLRIGIKRYGPQLTDSGEDGEKLELVSERGDHVIPIRMESAGIIKLISILNALVQAFGSDSVCLVIDELDSGIFEYLLGELLNIIQNHARGQLIFTSHNLRPLEMLQRDNIIFSTANPKNRYIHIQGGSDSRNLRDDYLRSITLGGQPEKIYMDADSLRIARAFRKAGRYVSNRE